MLQTRFTLALVWGVVAASFAMAQSLPPAAPATRTIAQAVDEAVRLVQSSFLSAEFMLVSGNTP